MTELTKKFRVYSLNKIKHPLFSGSLIMIIGSNFANFFSYIYHVVMGRLLSPPEYGTLVALFSLITLITSSFSFLSLVIVKFVSASGKNDINKLYTWFSNKALIFGGILASGVILFSPVISNFLEIDITLILLISPLLFFSVITFVYRSLLQGLLRFMKLTIVLNTNLAGRLLFGAVFVLLGYSVFGVVVGLIMISILVLILLKYFLRDLKKVNISNFRVKSKVFKYSIPMLISSVSVHALLSNDILLVKHYFSSDQAGLYAAVSTLGKIIFYGTTPISTVMFPLVSKKNSEGKSTKDTVLLSLILTALISFIVLVIFWFLPSLSVELLFGEKYLEASKYLFWMGIYMTIFTLSLLLMNYFLSKEKTKVVYLVLVAALVQAGGIWFKHESIFQIIAVSIIATTIMLFGFFFYLYQERSKNVDPTRNL